LLVAISIHRYRASRQWSRTGQSGKGTQDRGFAHDLIEGIAFGIH
jgi:hypothetical protein